MHRTHCQTSLLMTAFLSRSLHIQLRGEDRLTKDCAPDYIFGIFWSCMESLYSSPARRILPSNVRNDFRAGGAPNCRNLWSKDPLYHQEMVAQVVSYWPLNIWTTGEVLACSTLCVGSAPTDSVYESIQSGRIRKTCFYHCIIHRCDRNYELTEPSEHGGVLLQPLTHDTLYPVL